ncbi:MAG TPA: hypothetical protein VMV95_03480 [Bacillota bacterium]|nr:hypothetical protein [Bacillota bacterium]
MGFWEFLTGNKIKRSNSEKIARIKKEIQLLPKAGRIQKLREMDEIIYAKSRFDAISLDEIYECDFELSSEFLIYYFLYMDEEIRSKAEISGKKVLCRDSKGRFCRK